MAGDLQWLSVAEAAKGLRAGAFSAVELTTDTIDWIEKTNGITHAYVSLDAEGALAQAAAADAALAAGEDLGVFQGMTYSVKDVIAVGGLPMKCNSEIAADFTPGADSTVVARMRAAGAVCLGKVATHEFSWGVTSPPSRNPWDGESVTGGSSGGSGAAVAAGQGQVSIGADCGCSVRNPAGLNGVCGMRVTHGRVPTTGSVPLSMTMDTIGPLARTVTDTALMLNVMAGHDPLDPTSSSAPVPDFTARIGRDVTGLRVGVPTGYFFDHIETDIRDSVLAAVDTLAGLGAEIVEVAMPNAGYAGGAFLFVIAESAALLDDYTHERAGEFGIDVRNFAELGSLLLAKDYCKAQQLRTLVRTDFERAFADVDVIVTPTTAAVAKPPVDHPIFINVSYPDGHSEDTLWAYCRYTIPVSMAGCPALVVPCGLSADGLPVSMQIIAPAFDEQTAFQVGHAYEQATDWTSRRPSHLMNSAMAA